MKLLLYKQQNVATIGGEGEEELGGSPSFRLRPAVAAEGKDGALMGPTVSYSLIQSFS